MSTKAGAIEISGRPAGSVVWTWIVTAVAVAALIMSAAALTVAARGDGITTRVDGVNSEASGVAFPLWDAGKLQAMEGRVLAATVQAGAVSPLWDAGKLEAMEGRVLAG
jgi:hypothetical protein